MAITKQGIAGFVVALAAMSAVSPAAWAKNRLARIDSTFLKKVSQANMAEIQAGNLALRKSKNPQVRQIAEMIVKQHTNAENKLKNVAAKVDEAVPVSPDAKHRAIYQRLSQLDGEAFNKQYILTQMRDHHAAIALFKNEMSKGKHSEVRSFAASVLTDIYNHTKMIHTVAGGTYGIKTAMRPNRHHH